MELREQRHHALQQRASVDEERARLDEVKGVLADFEPFFHSLDRQGQLEVIRKFVKRIDLGVTNIVIHWRFSENECELTRSEVSPRARKKGHGGRVVEIGASDPICVHIRPEKQALLSVLRESVRGSCQEPSVRVRKQRKALRYRTATR